MVLRRRIGLRDWALAILVVTIGQSTDDNAIDWPAFWILLGAALGALWLWYWVFPRLPTRRAVNLEAGINIISAFAALYLVYESGGPRSPYVFFYALSIVFITSFLERARVRIALMALSSLCALAPIAYDWRGSVESDFIPTILIAVSVWLLAGALIAWKRVSAVNAELAARRLAYVEPLTESANRRALEQYIDEIADAGGGFAVALVRVGGIDEINRTLGHFVGDNALRSAVSAMRDASLDVDQVARLGGSEFAVLLPGGDDAAAQRWCARFHERLEIANAAAEDGARVSAVAGYATSTSHGTDLNDLVAAADAASGPLAERGESRVIAPVTPAERAERLAAELDEQSSGDRLPPIESIDAPSGVTFSIPVAVVLGVAIGATGGASSTLLSVAILAAAYFATFGSRIETLVAAVATMAASLAAVLANTPVSSVDQTRVLTILVTVGILADTVQRNSRKLTVSARRAAELSLTDPLTGLGNRRAFERTLIAMIPRGPSTHPTRELKLEGPPAVIALELADLRGLRARLGRAGTDLLLREIAEVLRDAVGEEGGVFRIGEDEFATIIRAHHHHHVDAVGARCADALRLLESEQRYADHGQPLEFHIGGALWSEGVTAAELAAAAVAEQSGAAPVAGFEPVAS